MANGRVRWDVQIEILFTVLVGLAFSQILNLASDVKFRGVVTFLCAALFFVILDNWYQLMKELSKFNIVSEVEVFTYALALVPYAGLIFLVGASANPIERFDAADWMGFNLVAICIFDAARRAATIFVRRKKGVPSEATDELMGEYVLYSATGIVYAALLAFFVLSASESLGSWAAAGTVVGIWFGIRLVDRLWVDKVGKHLKWR